MTLQSSASTGDPLRFSEIQTEFSPQGSAGNFRAYLKGGGIVDNINDVAPNVPTSGTMNFLQFLSAQCVTFSGSTVTYMTGTDTITAPPGAVSVVIKIWGGGGGGGGGDTLGYGGGGGGGGFVIKTMSVTGGTTQFTYAVGVGGSGGSYAASGTNGTSSTITGAATLTAGGGFRGIGYNQSNPLLNGTPGNGGSTSGGDANSEAGSAGSTYLGGNAGGQAYGGGAGGNGVPTQGTPPGGGGGGAFDGGGAPGARGEVQFTWS